MDSANHSRGWTIGALAVCIAACALYSTIVVKDFSLPLFGGGDVVYPEYTGYYFSKYLSFTPFPTLDLRNDGSFYPFGTSQVFQSWAIEQDLLLCALNRLAGPGPWLQLYYVLSLFVGAFGTFLLLRRDHGPPRALLAGFMVSFMNFYCMYEFPGHYSLTIVHWLNLSVVGDFVLLSRLRDGEPVTLRFASLKFLLILLCAGLELGYVAGIALLSQTLSLAAAAAMIHRRERGWKGVGLRLSGAAKSWREEARSRPILFASLAAAAAFVALFYVGIAAQIAAAASEFPDVAKGKVLYSSPFRVLLPYLPPWNPFNAAYLADSQESPGAGSVGWSFLLPALLGVWHAGKDRKVAPLAPFLLLALLFVFNLPSIGLLGRLPWFRYSRILSRVTCAYPALFAIFALGVDLPRGRAKGGAVIALFLLLAVAETTFAFSKLDYVPWKPDANFDGYMAAVRNAEGEAVLDWPFCIAGGNTIGTAELGPYYGRTFPVFALRRFHGKKVVGQFFGRLDQSQFEPFLLMGIDRLFSPDSNPYRAQRQTRCLTERELEFLRQFFLLGDFAGINLYADLMPPSCVYDMIRKFGEPVAWTRYPPAGSMLFIPKRKGLRARVDVERAKKLKFLLPLPGNEFELLADRKSPFYVSSGFECGVPQDDTFRWMTGKESRIEFLSPREADAEIRLAIEKVSEEQEIRFAVNGRELGTSTSPSPSCLVETVLRFRARKGINQVLFRSSDWNHRSRDYFPATPQLLSGRVYRARLVLSDPAGPGSGGAAGRAGGGRPAPP